MGTTLLKVRCQLGSITILCEHTHVHRDFRQHSGVGYVLNVKELSSYLNQNIKLIMFFIYRAFETYFQKTPKGIILDVNNITSNIKNWETMSSLFIAFAEVDWNLLSISVICV